MKHLNLILIFSLLTYNTEKSFGQSSLLKEVNNWNKLTLLSLEDGLKQARKSEEIREFQNGKISFSMYVDYKNGSTSIKSIRYSLLKNILSKKHKDFYLMEANRSGERVEILSYLVEFNGKIADVFVYHFIDERWVLKSTYKGNLLKLNRIFGKDLVPSRKGVNDDDVIISKFLNGKAITSKYYLDYTLPKDSGIEELLNIQ